MLTFDADTHTYRWKGALVPNVTRILAPLIDLSRIQPDVLESARQKGVAIHKMVELHCKGTLDLATLPDWLWPHLEAWERFLSDTGFKLLASEERVYHDTLRYAGTLDLRGTMNGSEAIVDLKRTFLMGPVTGLQTAGYTMAVNRERPRKNHVKKRYAMRLKDNGYPQLEAFDDPDDEIVFTSLLHLHNWRAKHGYSIPR